MKYERERELENSQIETDFVSRFVDALADAAKQSVAEKLAARGASESSGFALTHQTTHGKAIREELTASGESPTLTRLLQSVVTAERERCAKAVEALGDFFTDPRQWEYADVGQFNRLRVQGALAAIEKAVAEIREGSHPAQADPVAAERERCAKIAETHDAEYTDRSHSVCVACAEIAAKIRSGQ